MSVYSLSDTVQYYQGCHIPTERKVSQKTQVKELLDLIATNSLYFLVYIFSMYIYSIERRHFNSFD